jgi:hypothetical protein
VRSNHAIVVHNKKIEQKMNTKLVNSILSGALIVTLSGDVPDLTTHIEAGGKLFLQPQEEPKLSDGLQLHLAETPCEERLIWPTVTCNSGVQSFSQTKTDECELTYWPSSLLVRVKILTESPSQIFSPAPHFTDLISAA